MRNSEKSEIGQYWIITNGNDFLNALTAEADPYIVVFDPTARNDVYKLDEIKLELLPEDFRPCPKVGRATVDSCAKKASDVF